MLRIAAALAAALVCLSSSNSLAQRAQAPQPWFAEILRPTPQRAVRFRTRTAEERIASITRLVTAQRQRSPRATQSAALAPTARSLAGSFVLTPRNPYVEGQGGLHAFGASFDSWVGPTGELFFHHDDVDPVTRPGFALRIAAPDARRLLIECSIEGNSSSFNAQIWQPVTTLLWSDSTTAYQNAISFLTPSLPPATNGYYIIGISPTEPNPGMYGWVLYGCEVTRLSLP